MAQGGNPQALKKRAYLLSQPENILYTVCLQCNTQCTLKVKVQDGVVSKIDGNPYSPMNLFPHLPYELPLVEAAKVDASVCPKGQAGVETLYDPYRVRRFSSGQDPGARGSGRPFPLSKPSRRSPKGEGSSPTSARTGMCPVSRTSSFSRTPPFPRLWLKTWPDPGGEDVSGGVQGQVQRPPGCPH